MKLPSIAITTLLIPVASSSAATVLETNPQECIDPTAYDADTDFFPQKFVPHETTDLLTVSYHRTYKIITNKFSDKSYLLYQCGTEPPKEEVDSGVHHLVLSVPHTGGIAVTQTPQIPPLELLGKRTDISAYVGNPSLVSSPCLSHLMTEDDVVETIYFPDDPYNSTLNVMGADDFIARNPEAIVLAGPTGNVDGDRRMSVAASQERTAVATFDWLGMYAALFNLEGKANQIIQDTESRYKCSAENAASLTADVQEGSKPKILWAQYFDGIGWSIAECPAWDAAYYCEYAQHCGAEIITRPDGVGFSQTYGTPTVYWYLTDEEFFDLGKDAETWIYPSKTFESVYYEKKEMLDQFKSVQNKNVYDTQGQGPDAWHEQRLAEYDVVALDMCTLVGTNNPNAVHQRRWFRSYFDEAIGSMGVCDVPGNEVEEAYVPAQAECTLLGGGSVAGPGPAEPVAEPSPPVSEPVVNNPSPADPTVADPSLSDSSDPSVDGLDDTNAAISDSLVFVMTIASIVSVLLA